MGDKLYRFRKQNVRKARQYYAVRFASDETGSMTFFALFMILMMMLVGGIAVDLSINEMARVKHQNTLDRAVLAAADMDQTLAPKSVVKDYFSKSGLNPDGLAITVSEGTTKIVSANLTSQTKTTIMSHLGVNQLPIYIRSTAAEIIDDIEVSFVLDISGSMRYDNRLTNMKTAAKAFVTEVLDADSGHNTSINLVPYAGQTNIGPFMFNRLSGVRYPAIELDKEDGGMLDTATGLHMYPNVSSCLELETADFSTASLPTGRAQTAHFMYWPTDTGIEWGWCPQDSTAVQYAQDNSGTLNTFIQNMPMHDGTGTPYAMKYALSLLDPAARPHFAAMAGAGLVPSKHSGRPADWGTSAKYIVLMTDGKITEQMRPVDTLHEDNPTLQLKARAGDETQIATASDMVKRFESVCKLAKENGVIIFTVAFEAPSDAQDQMKSCASSASHFFTAEGSELTQVFSNIARQLQALQLTQ